MKTDNQEFQKFLEELKELGKKGFKVGDGVALTSLCLSNIKQSFIEAGRDLESINFPFIGKMVVSDIIESNENDGGNFIEVKCEEKDLIFTFREEDAKESFLILIYRDGINPPKGYGVN